MKDLIEKINMRIHLQHGDEIDIVAVQHFLNKFDQLILELLLALEPGGVEVETQRGAVRVEVPVEVVTQQSRELIPSLDVGAGVDHVAPGQRFVEGWVISPIQLVHDHFPNGVASGWTVVRVAVAFVRHTEIQSVRPNGHTAQRRRDGRVVDEELIGHHFELLVAAHA